MDVVKLAADLRRDEGFREHAYQDSEGFWTIGYGRLIDERAGGKISLDEANYLLINDIHTAQDDARAVFPGLDALSEPQQRALINMAFNLGRTRLAQFRKMLAALYAGDFKTAADEALDSRWARQVGDRADRLAALIREG